MEGVWLWTQMQGGINWILPKEINANRFLPNSLARNLEKTTYVTLYGTEQRERVYGLC
jgi:hypothetical protein